MENIAWDGLGTPPTANPYLPRCGRRHLAFMTWLARVLSGSRRVGLLQHFRRRARTGLFISLTDRRLIHLFVDRFRRQPTDSTISDGEGIKSSSRVARYLDFAFVSAVPDFSAPSP